jgi:cytochrome c nitrite reductase small subunit
MLSKWPLIAGIAILLLVLGVFVWATDAPAYLGHEPATCNNCHVMDAAYENWYHGAHERFTECTDCHLPHQNLIAYYYIKGKSGLHDVLWFVTASYPDAIRATAETRNIVQVNCIRCHADTVDGIVMGAQPFDRYCWDCHRTVAHGERGISLLPYQHQEEGK